MRKGPEAYRRLKQARGVFGHPLNEVWTALGPKIVELLIAMEIAWTSIDGVRFLAETDYGGTTLGPVVIWIGVHPDSLKAKVAFDTANDILLILNEFGIRDVEVEFRESVYRRSVGSPLLKSVSAFHNTADVRGPLTTALGLRIAAADHPDGEGTTTIYFAEGGESPKILALTCHHVVLKVDAITNQDYTFLDGSPRKYIQLLGARAFQDVLDSTRFRIGNHGIMIDIHKRNIGCLEEKLSEYDKYVEDDCAETRRELAEVHRQLDVAEGAIEDLEKFYAAVKSNWGPARQRVIGHIRHSPPIRIHANQFTEDWAAIEHDQSKFTHFQGNVIDLGTEITPPMFSLKMYPRDDGRTSFKYPAKRLLPLRGMISEELMRAPDMLDRNNEPCLIALKNGGTTGVTIGPATGIESFVRDEITGNLSRAWAVYNYDNKSDVFSAPGDSGAMVADGFGRMGGMITGGSGKTETSDVTYVTPMCKL